jgi:hypothetical protein
MGHRFADHGVTRPTEVAIAVLVLGIAASISAVVPGVAGSV